MAIDQSERGTQAQVVILLFVPLNNKMLQEINNHNTSSASAYADANIPVNKKGKKKINPNCFLYNCSPLASLRTLVSKTTLVAAPHPDHCCGR